MRYIIEPIQVKTPDDLRKFACEECGYIWIADSASYDTIYAQVSNTYLHIDECPNCSKKVVVKGKRSAK